MILSGFEIEAFFTYSEPERRVIDDERRTPTLKLALALQIGFLRMTGRLLEALRMVPPVLWRHLGTQFGIEAPDSGLAAHDVPSASHIVRAAGSGLRRARISRHHRSAAPRVGAGD